MSELRTCRFEQYDYYDIMEDVEKSRIMCITNIGTWHTDIVVKSSGQVRQAKQAFQEYVLGALQIGLEPGEVVME